MIYNCHAIVKDLASGLQNRLLLCEPNRLSEKSLSSSQPINPISTESVWSFTYSGEVRVSSCWLYFWPCRVTTENREQHATQSIPTSLSQLPSPFDTFSYTLYHTSGFTCHQSPAALQKPVHAHCDTDSALLWLLITLMFLFVLNAIIVSRRFLNTAKKFILASGNILIIVKLIYYSIW